MYMYIYCFLQLDTRGGQFHLSNLQSHAGRSLAGPTNRRSRILAELPA